MAGGLKLLAGLSIIQLKTDIGSLVSVSMSVCTHVCMYECKAGRQAGRQVGR